MVSTGLITMIRDDDGADNAIMTMLMKMMMLKMDMSRSSKTRAELQSLLAGGTETHQDKPWEALAVPTGKPLSMFDPSCLPAAYTEFLFGDCVPFLKRETPT